MSNRTPQRRTSRPVLPCAGVQNLEKKKLDPRDQKADSSWGNFLRGKTPGAVRPLAWREGGPFLLDRSKQETQPPSLSRGLEGGLLHREKEPSSSNTEVLPKSEAQPSES